MWELKLRPNATWHDGTPVTPDDVAFTPRMDERTVAMNAKPAQ
jgi:ABC-type transport system substrate-binding protein